MKVAMTPRSKNLVSIKELVKSEDKVEKTIVDELDKTFITPLDREDINRIAMQMGYFP